MPRIYSHELAYKFEREIRKALRGRANLDALVAELVPELVDAVPSEAYEAKEPADAGYLFWTGDTNEVRAVDMQRDLMSAHLSLKPKIPIQLQASNTGGSSHAGLAVISTIHQIRRAGRTVNVHVSGDASSMGSIILQAANRRTIEEFGMLMLHESSWAMDQESHYIHADTVAGAEKERAAICRLYSQRSGKTVQYWLDRIHRRDLYLNAREALDEGLVDAILPVPTGPK